MLNERAVKIPRCPEDTYLCPLKKFEKIFDDSLHNCEFDKWCEHEKYKPIYDELLIKLKNEESD